MNEKARKIKAKIKAKKFPKSLKKGSLNQKVFSVVASLIKEVVKEAESCLDLFCEFSMGAIAQKFHGTYYSNIEDERLRAERIREWQIKKAFRDLQSMGYIKTEKNGKEIHLSKKGALEFLRHQIQEKRQKWDGKWRIVVFDIAEERKSQRDFLRRRLSWLGFKELQKSVWIFPYDIKREVEELLTICKVDIMGDIRFLTTEKMEEDEDFKREFSLD